MSNAATPESQIVTSEMTGTPSQVEWAERIKRLAGEEFDRVAQSFRSVAQKQDAVKRADTETILQVLQEKRAAVMSRQQAGYFIRDWQEISDQVRKMIIQDPRFQLIKEARPKL
jgi:hypothetical protein